MRSRIPFRLIAQDVLRQGDRLLDAHAAVTERARRALEQRVGRRVVQVDVELVRKHELHEPQRIVGAGLLAEAVGRRIVEIDRRGIDDGCQPCRRLPCCCGRGIPGSLMTAEAFRLARCCRGTFQYGLKTRWVISSLKIGVWVSCLPTTTRIGERRPCSPSKTSSRISGNVHEHVAGRQGRAAASASAPCSSRSDAMRCSNGTFSAATTSRTDRTVVGRGRGGAGTPSLLPAESVAVGDAACPRRAPSR